MFNFVPCPQFNEYFYGNVVFVEAVKKHKVYKTGKRESETIQGKTMEVFALPAWSSNIFLEFHEIGQSFFVAM